MEYSRQISQHLQITLADLLKESENVIVQTMFNLADERDISIVMISVDSINRINVDLEDFNYAVNITLDTFVEDDIYGETFNDLKKKIYDKLNEKPLMNAEDIPVVGYFLNDITQQITGTSNRVTFSLRIVTSE